MTITELQHELTRLDLLCKFSLRGEILPDGYTLLYDPQEKRWRFFYTDERGDVYGLIFDSQGHRQPYIYFDSESKACLYIYNFALNIIKDRKKTKEEANAYTGRKKRTKIVSTQVSGEGFIMTATKEVYTPPEDFKVGKINE